MSDNSKRRIVLLPTSHSVSMLRVALVTNAGFSWLFVLPVQFRGHQTEVDSPLSKPAHRRSG